MASQFGEGASQFEGARELVRASLQSCFGRPIVVMLSDGSQRTVQGYIKSTELNGNKVKRLLTDAELPPLASLMDEGKRYVLAHSNALDMGRDGDSQITREYLMSLESAGAKHGWSEFTDDP
ncbi:hypothetical protein C9I98_21585 [Photobacterium sanctipauli]|uniref:Uncharacterized protein n=1 Tax=Photobacterium sanctipauli TaxID=1342794 RepID=A0A2T3NIH4_9GAMM|nr:hypothetical protein [Photobacterium sanctipauli]PSW14780.1 hypothetical protein C9I98_21585 [Photobacterium sanctipauli]